MRRKVQSPQRQQRLMAFRVTGTGTAVITEGSKMATLTDNGTGDYTLTFIEPFARAPVVTMSPLTSLARLRISTVSTTAVRILSFSTDGTTALDSLFHVLVMGSEVVDEN